mmetsp:Transcript_6278/g.10258  ORF Transcript_6278/g.10258 Transcript_6278/m.10258 type:complete len:86 (-) Transcript_6278:163-420(-)
MAPCSKIDIVSFPYNSALPSYASLCLHAMRGAGGVSCEHAVMHEAKEATTGGIWPTPTRPGEDDSFICNLIALHFWPFVSGDKCC